MLCYVMLCDVNPENCFFLHMHMHLSASNVCIIYEKTKGKFPWSGLGKQNIKNIKVHLFHSSCKPNFSFHFHWFIFIWDARISSSFTTDTLNLLIVLLIVFLIEEHVHPGS